MSIEFIELIEMNPSDPQWPRTSSLARTDRELDGLRTIGELPHSYEWRPKTPAQRDKLIAWLSDLSYPEYQCQACARAEQDCSELPCPAVEAERAES